MAEQDTRKTARKSTEQSDRVVSIAAFAQCNAYVRFSEEKGHRVPEFFDVEGISVSLGPAPGAKLGAVVRNLPHGSPARGAAWSFRYAW